MGRPQLLMLDEPSLGLAPLIVREIFHIISSLRELGDRSCWSSRTPALHWKLPISAMCWKRGRFPCPARRAFFLAMNASPTCIWAATPDGGSCRLCHLRTRRANHSCRRRRRRRSAMERRRSLPAWVKPGRSGMRRGLPPDMVARSPPPGYERGTVSPCFRPTGRR